MKKIILILLVIIGSVQASAQFNNCRITRDGIGAVQINMSQANLEKMFNKKFTLINALTNAVSFCDTASVTLGNAKLDLFFQRQYQADNSFTMYLTGVKTYSSECKTANGIAVGATRQQVLAAYKGRNSKLVAECDNEDCTRLSKTRSHVYIKNNSTRSMIIYLVNNKIAAIEVGTIWSDEE